MGRMIVALAMLSAVLAFGPAFAKDGGSSGSDDGDRGGHDGKDDGQVVTTTGGGGTETVNNPEPGTLLLLSTGIAGVGAVTWRRLRRK